MTRTEADYGALTPQDVASDRFGLHQDTEVWASHAPTGGKLRTIVSTVLNAPVRRLDLILSYWVRNRYHDTTEYRLSVHGRPLIIKHYHDGRIKLILDHKVVYEQTRKMRYGQLIEIVEHYDDHAEEIAEEESLEQVRRRLERTHK